MLSGPNVEYQYYARIKQSDLCSVIGSNYKNAIGKISRTRFWYPPSTLLLNCASSIWTHDLAALVQIVSEGKDIWPLLVGLLGMGINER